MEVRMKESNIQQNGFTIFEMIVAIGIFSVVVTIAVSSMLILTNSERKAITLQNTQDNLRFALEAMAKEMRTGENFSSGCAIGCTFINYRTARGQTVSYRFNQTSKVIEKASTGSGCSTPFPENCYFPFTSTEVIIDILLFYVTGVANDNLQPKITIVLQASTPGTERTKSRLRLQTTVSQRRLDT
ncbi:MAG: type II secretion system protein [Patescibacteria group bacterium]